MSLHYPRKLSNKKRVRKIGFRARMKTRGGRKTINRKAESRPEVQAVRS